MKSKELIKQLQELDPLGEIEVCVGNEDIYFAERLPAYYDGRLQVLILDEKKKPYYHIDGLKITGKGDKIKLHTVSLEDILWHNKNAVIDTSELSARSQKEYQDAVDEIKAEIIKHENEMTMIDVLK